MTYLSALSANWNEYGKVTLIGQSPISYSVPQVFFCPITVWIAYCAFWFCAQAILASQIVLIAMLGVSEIFLKINL